jgi:hypothetical protein
VTFKKAAKVRQKLLIIKLPIFSKKVRWVNNIHMKKVIAFGALFAPFIVSAQISQGLGGGASGLIVFIKDLLSQATILILAAAVVYFLWNVFGYVMAAGDPETRKEKQSGIIYGVIGIAVMVSIWGLVNFLTSSAKLDTTTRTAPPLSL